MAGGVEFVLQRRGGVEVEERGAVAAAGDVFVDGGEWGGGVGEGGGRVVAFAVVEDVCAVPVVHAEGFGEGIEVAV